MTIGWATFVRNEVEPGWPIMADDVPLGKRYRVDLDRVERLTMINRTTGQSIALECIYAVDGNPPGYLPLIALQLDPEA